MATIDLATADVATLRSALDAGEVTATEIALRYLERIARYDRQGTRLNAVPVLNPDLLAEARVSDERRRHGQALPLDGIPYLVKASYAVRGLPVSSGAPAFEHLIAREDAHVIRQLRAAGAIAVGITNMPPMAAGGMQRGLYGRAESPYNAAFLTAAYASGSSNGSGTGLAAGFGAFALAEETWSSGRAPASNNALVAYTPSRGVISIRGNWPLIPSMDVVVPYARTVADLLEILDVVVADDPETRGDFWRTQRAVAIPPASHLRPDDYRALADPDALQGRRVGVPRLYIGTDDATTRPIATRRSVLDLWDAARRDLEALGAEVVEVDVPLIVNYDADRPGAETMMARGLVPPGFPAAEGASIVFAWHDYLAANGQPGLDSLALVDGAMIIPRNPERLPDRYEGIPDFTAYPAMAAAGVPGPNEIPDLAESLRGLEEVRRIDLEEWMDAQGLDCLVWPAAADVGPADADTSVASADIAWRNGTWVSNGNQAIRHHGVPTVTVPMGLMADIGMPVGLTFAGRGYDDARLLSFAYAFERSGERQVRPPRTPSLPGDRLALRAGAVAAAPPAVDLHAEASPVADDGMIAIAVSGTAPGAESVEVKVNGEDVAVERDGEAYRATALVPWEAHYVTHSRWRLPYGSIVTVLARGAGGGCAAATATVGGL